ncbi:MAG: sensor histidine kinase [Candidatus Accumulibacter sp.]|jgi:two-component system sensor histidine kinase TctE|nr:sensor histidine kinase [Accumulibacter sp.]
MRALPPRQYSARRHVLAWITLPLIVILAIDTGLLYRSALSSVNVAYDRTLLATAHAVGDSVRFENGDYRMSLPLALFEIYETGQSGRYYYRVNDSSGRLISGDEDLVPYQGELPKNAVYPAAVQFYEDSFHGAPIRVAALFQPVFSNDDSGAVIIQIAEPMKIREESARDILRSTLLRQGMLVLVVCLVVYVSVTRALRPLNQLRDELDRRSADDLSALTLRTHLLELSTVTQAMNHLMERLERLINYQKRFIANASHQLRTPLAALKTQLQSGLRKDAPAEVVLREISGTVERTITLANQMLLLAKIEQHRSQNTSEPCNLHDLAREAAVELSPLIAEKNLDFELGESGGGGWIRGDAWLVGELVRNLLNNAIQHTPPGQKLGIHVHSAGDTVELLVWDSGGGIPEDQIDLLFEPFSKGFSKSGSGLGLAISREIARSLDGRIVLANAVRDSNLQGLDARVSFTLVSEQYCV